MTQALLAQCRDYIQNGGILAGAVFFPVVIPAHEWVDTAAVSRYVDAHRDLFFAQQLLAMIDNSGKKDSDIYKKARIDRRLFSKIRSNKAYAPAKKTVIALCLALELSREGADLLLSSAGYSLSPADRFDLVIAFCIEYRVFDFYDINEALEHFGFEPF